MVKEGHPPSSVVFGVESLKLSDLQDERMARAKLRARLADLKHLRNLGYPQQEAMDALKKYGDLRSAYSYLERKERKSGISIQAL
mmetsp:Transcript_41068/g.66061  ORF Transcript_41068/g.66061 Transcript_41068/m.66061 type:complete len:85 (+) Transcript_41068:932-1186(+)